MKQGWQCQKIHKQGLQGLRITSTIHPYPCFLSSRAHTYYYMGHMHAGMENQYMDQYQNNNIATLYILNHECMMLFIEKSSNIARKEYRICIIFRELEIRQAYIIVYSHLNIARIIVVCTLFAGYRHLILYILTNFQVSERLHRGSEFLILISQVTP